MPSIIYFHHVCPVSRKYTGKMELGQEEHLELERLEKRRRLKKYNLEEGQRIFHTVLYSERLGLEGKLDLHIVQKNYIYPVEIKYTHGAPYLNHKYQFIAYAMLFKRNIIISQLGVVFYILLQQKDLHIIDDELRQWFIEERDKKMHMIENEIDPGIAENCIYNCPYYSICREN